MLSEELSVKIRIKAWDMAFKAKASHMGGNFSMADVLSVLYNEVVDTDLIKAMDPNRDRVILSKGHCCAVFYAMLAEKGFFLEEELGHFGEDGSILSCHISSKVPGVELSSGSLGHGASVAAGIALNSKLNNENYNVYAICGDGECNEGSVWEMVMFAGQHKLDNFTVIIDANKIQAMGYTKDIIDLQPIAEKWKLFGWTSIEIDGHDFDEIRNAFNTPHNGKPKVIVANTIKGHGVSFMEDDLWWHYQIPFGDYYNKAKEELEAELEKIKGNS